MQIVFRKVSNSNILHQPFNSSAVHQYVLSKRHYFGYANRTPSDITKVRIRYGKANQPAKNNYHQFIDKVTVINDLKDSKREPIVSSNLRSK